MAPPKTSSIKGKAKASSSSHLTPRQQAMKRKSKPILPPPPPPPSPPHTTPTTTTRRPTTRSHLSHRSHQRPPIPIPNTFGFPPGSPAAKRLRILKSNPISTQLFFDPHTCQLLGILDDVRMLLGNLGWERFMSHRPLTIPTLVLEFLASYELIESPLSPPTHKFQLGGTAYDLSHAEFTTAFGFDSFGTVPPGPRSWSGYDRQGFWKRISDHTLFVSFDCREHQIMHPALRYCHRLVNNLYFNRHHANRVVDQTLQFLHMMVHGTTTSGQLDHGLFIGKMLAATSAHSSIGIKTGGLITILADHLGVPYDIATAIDPSSSLDISALLRMGHLSPVHGHPDRWWWKFRNENYIYLPHPHVNWCRTNRLTFSKDVEIPPIRLLSDSDETLPPTPDADIPASSTVPFDPTAVLTRLDDLEIHALNCLDQQQSVEFQLQILEGVQEWSERDAKDMQAQIAQLQPPANPLAIPSVCDGCVSALARIAVLEALTAKLLQTQKNLLEQFDSMRSWADMATLAAVAPVPPPAGATSPRDVPMVEPSVLPPSAPSDSV